MATTSIADKLAKLEKKIAKREKTIADETKELDKDRAEYNKLYIMFLEERSLRCCQSRLNISLGSISVFQKMTRETENPFQSKTREEY